MLLNLHVIRMLENGSPLPALTSGTSNSEWQVLLDNCYAAVSNPTGRSQAFQAAKYPTLNDSYLVYKASLPTDHHKPDRPAWLKSVSAKKLYNDNLAYCHRSIDMNILTCTSVRNQKGHTPCMLTWHAPYIGDTVQVSHCGILTNFEQCTHERVSQPPY